jgi:hypothetical protein
MGGLAGSGDPESAGRMLKMDQVHVVRQSAGGGSITGVGSLDGRQASLMTTQAQLRSWHRDSLGESRHIGYRLDAFRDVSPRSVARRHQ